MLPSFLLFYLIFYILSTQENLLNAQLEEIIYTFDFNGPSDWIESTGGFINWVNATNDPHCNALGGPYCLELTVAEISRVIPTSNYHTIRIQIGTSYTYTTHAIICTNILLPHLKYMHIIIKHTFIFLYK